MTGGTPADASEYAEWRTLGLVTLTSIATVIGSGILALPVTMYATSLPLFLVLFTLTLVATIFAAYANVELLQRARLAQAAATPPGATPAPISLYTLSGLYLPGRLSRSIFHAAVLFQFLALLVSYGLAGPQAVWQTVSASGSLHAPPLWLFAVYWAVGTVCVLAFLDALLPVFGSFTVLKGALFAGVIAIVALLPSAARVTSFASLIAERTAFAHAAPPFLMSTVALGGIFNTSPVTFALLPASATPAQLRRYRGAIVAALVISYLLNVSWVIAILQVVPRTAVSGKPSLEMAYKRGQISTVPLIAALIDSKTVSGGLLEAISMIIELFILVSVGVSYFVMSAGLKSFIDGCAEDWKRLDSYVSAAARRWGAYVVCFGMILGLILSDPDGFIKVLTRFSSLMLNIEAGLTVFVMLYFCRFRAERSMYLPVATTVDIAEEEGEASSSLSRPKASQADPIVDESPTDSYESVENEISISNENDDRVEPLPDRVEGPENPAFMLARWQVVPSITFGVLFYLIGSMLAAFGPLLGIKLAARE